ncbi:MAG: ROK family transcriptional regulator [Planctomycetaceae bacterium]|nr:ROK family transcriptional regulator [Planctomycetaceae bacterium]
MQKVTTAEMRKINQNKVFRLIYEERRIARIDLAGRLNISLPTITQNLKELEDANLIERNGVFQSTGGRKPQVITCVSNAKIAIGVEISKDMLRLVAVDLYGDVVKRDCLPNEYRNDENYYRELAGHVSAFCESLRISQKRILGVGIAIQGLVSQDGTTVLYGKILGSAGVRLEDFSRHIGLPCLMSHNVEAAAYAELWYSKDLKDAIYISLSGYLGGALIINRKIHKGPDLQGGLIEHLNIHSGGIPCYCGRSGCFTAYCSANVLLKGTGDSYSSFFNKLRNGDKKRHARWKTYLDDLARAIHNLHMVVDCDVILGGHIAPYLTAEDLGYLDEKLGIHEEYGPSKSFMRIGHSDPDNSACGGALPFIKQFLESI